MLRLTPKKQKIKNQLLKWPKVTTKCAKVMLVTFWRWWHPYQQQISTPKYVTNIDVTGKMTKYD